MYTILLSAYACLPNYGSEEGNGWHYATLLSQRGLRVHCITREAFRERCEAALKETPYPNLTIHYVAVPDWLERSYGNLVGLYVHYVYWQWKAAELAQQLDKEIDFDLVHHVTYSSLQLGSFMYRVGKPFIFGPVGGGQRVPSAFKHYLGKYWSRERMRDAISWLMIHFNPGFYQTMRKADRVLISNTDTYQLVRKYRQNQHIERTLDSGITNDFISAGPIERDPNPSVLNLLWVGRLLPRKALELTIHALSRVDPNLPIRLTVVGGQGEMASEVQAYIARYGVGDRVDWVGHVPHDQVKQFYRQSDVFFFTSLRDSGPMQLLEAMANSLPIVTLDLHGQAELVDGSNGLKIPVTTPLQVVTKLAQAIEWLYHNPTERLAIGRRAYAFAGTQLWDKKITYFVDRLYPGLIKSGGGSHRTKQGQPVNELATDSRPE